MKRQAHPGGRELRQKNHDSYRAAGQGKAEQLRRDDMLCEIYRAHSGEIRREGKREKRSHQARDAEDEGASEPRSERGESEKVDRGNEFAARRKIAFLAGARSSLRWEG